jgi:hypothetical protein
MDVVQMKSTEWSPWISPRSRPDSLSAVFRGAAAAAADRVMVDSEEEGAAAADTPQVGRTGFCDWSATGRRPLANR